MPLEKYRSLCDKNAPQIVSKDVKASRTHIANNRKRAFVTYYRIDGVVITEGNKCDYLLFNEDTKDAYLIELKGSRIVSAAKQLDETAKKLTAPLAGYTLHFRIVASKCTTHAVESQDFLKYKRDWKKKYKNSTFKYKTEQLVDNI